MSSNNSKLFLEYFITQELSRLPVLFKLKYNFKRGELLRHSSEFLLKYDRFIKSELYIIFFSVKPSIFNIVPFN